MFEVIGLPAGNYSYTWKDVETGATGVCANNTRFCWRSINFFNSPSIIEVTVRDTDTNATKTVRADAYWWDAWH